MLADARPAPCYADAVPAVGCLRSTPGFPGRIGHLPAPLARRAPSSSLKAVHEDASVASGRQSRSARLRFEETRHLGGGVDILRIGIDAGVRTPVEA